MHRSNYCSAVQEKIGLKPKVRPWASHVAAKARGKRLGTPGDTAAVERMCVARKRRRRSLQPTSRRSFSISMSPGSMPSRGEPWGASCCPKIARIDYTAPELPKRGDVTIFGGHIA